MRGFAHGVRGSAHGVSAVPVGYAQGFCLGFALGCVVMFLLGVGVI